MSFWKKSKYKKKSTGNWWDDIDEDDYNPYGGGGGYYDGYGGYGREYGRTYYKPRYDMSIGLETRVKSLIQTITGKSLRLVKAEGWGSDDEYFYYNADDLENASDDEILGRILHQLGKEIYVGKEQVKTINEAEPDYKHLLTTLEDNRADRQLQERYGGVRYYAEEVWENRKFKDNPMNSYTDEVELTNPEDFDAVVALVKNDPETKVPDYAFWQKHKEEYANWVRRKNQKLGIQQNDAWEFCFNLNAYQNHETEWDFTKKEIMENFQKALPYVQEYLDSSSLEDALRVYPEIKKYYPIPTPEQQQQMDSGMSKTEGLSGGQMASKRVAVKKAEKEAKEQEDEEGQSFKRDFADNNEYGSFDTKRELSTYKKYLAEHQGSVNALHALLRSILQDNAIKRFNRPFKRGKLDAKRIYKYIATDNLRIFKKPRTISDKRYMMSIVVDMSGSMRGVHSKYATQGTIVLAEVLEKLGFPYEIIAYNGSVYGVKKFTSALQRDIIPTIEYAEGDNNEADTIDVVTRHIQQFDPDGAYRKAVIWVTDGQSNNPTYVKQKITTLEKKHNTTVYAIGIGDGIGEKFLKKTYNTWIKVDKVSDLPKELVNLMRTQFRRR